MNRRVAIGMAVLTLAGLWSSWGPGAAQAQEPKAGEPKAGEPNVAAFRAPTKGVFEAVPPEREENESFSRHDVNELLADDPRLDTAKNTTFRRDVWNLKFEYKPLRIVWVDIPQKSGKMQRKPIYYLVYCVTNVPLAQQKHKPPRYGWMHPAVADEKTGEHMIEYVDRPIQPVLEFVLESPEYNKAYPDRVIPLAMDAIRQREDRTQPGWSQAKGTVAREALRNTVQMHREIGIGQTVWGVATWEEIDPRIDRFTIYVQGLTNAYRWKVDPAAYRKGSPLISYRKVALKTLKLNFWRPGDDRDIDEAEIRRGQPGEPDYSWLYLPSLSGSK